MKQERDNLVGDQLIVESFELWGKVSGTVRVAAGGRFYLRGAIYGDLIVQDGGRVHIYGHISGSLHVHEGAKVIHSGLIAGDAVNDGGRLYIDRDGMVSGKVKTNSGKTQIETRKIPARRNLSAALL